MLAFRSKMKEVVEKKYGKMTHEQIAAATGIGRRPTITVWMSGRLFRRLDMDILEPVSAWLECDPSELYEIVRVDEEVSAS